jgi:hypothetical protein
LHLLAYSLHLSSHPQPKLRKKLGCCHHFKSKNTTSSQQTRVAHTATVVCGEPRKTQQTRRDGQKQMKLASLPRLVPSPEHMVGKEDLKGKPLFFSGTVNQFVLNNPVPNSKTLSAVCDLKVVNTHNGAHMV